jgi:hypothetical protein
MYVTRATRENIPSPKVKSESLIIKYRRNADDISNGISPLKISFLKEKFFAIKTAIPKTKKILVIFEPNTLPITISLALDWTATKDETSSGSDVPTPTISTPTTKEGRPRAVPALSAPSTKKSEALTRAKIARARTDIQIRINTEKPHYSLD